MEQPWMSVVVPTYNEELTIVSTVTAVREWLEEHDRPFEIVVVDNASEDRTVQLVKPLVDDERVRLLQNEVNRGKGYSVRRGMLAAGGELRLLCDADCAPSLASLSRMVEAMEAADVVAGSRSMPDAEVGREQPLRRRIFGWPFIGLTRLLMREPTRDIYCGFKLWRAVAAEAVFSRQRLDGWVYDAESLGMARGLGFGVSEVGIVWINREASNLSILQTLVPATRELLAARRSVREQVGSRIATTPEPVAESPESTI
jgi:glycosyltransferase involved in cell wall biosynthesis